MENCCLLASKLPSATPRIFFTRDLNKDCDCEILVVETLKKDLRKYERTQKNAKTVLITSTPFTSLDSYLSLGIESTFVCMSKGEVLFSTAESSTQSEDESEIEKFSQRFKIEKSYELDKFSNLLNVGMLNKKLWLVGSIKANSSDVQANEFPGNLIDSGRSISPFPYLNSFGSDDVIHNSINDSQCCDECSSEDCCSEDSLSDKYENCHCKQRRHSHHFIVNTNGSAFRNLMHGSRRSVFRSSNGEPSELRSLNNMRPRRTKNVENILFGEEIDGRESSISNSNNSFLNSHNNSYFCIFNDDHVFRIRGVCINVSKHFILYNTAKKKRKSSRTFRNDRKRKDSTL